ncbi:MAG: hypothetical protein KIC66_02625 [Clostridium sp.]|uniref:Uncharacterized protein n=1 Tax=Clostridium paraputrificum TaxID=29363 RepID=A0A6N3AEF2_9CLOT|nr:hypothetical protein [Clostridium sp.]MBS5925968.1 hypothetical protein [Clostridium sp.]
MLRTIAKRDNGCDELCSVISQIGDSIINDFNSLKERIEKYSCKLNFNEEDIEDIYINHLNSDILKLYKYLTKEWIVYMKYIEKEYPFLYSFALTNIPFKQC